MINQELLDKFNKGKCTPEEIMLLQQYFQQENLEELSVLFDQDWEDIDTDAQIPIGLEQRVFNRLKDNIQGNASSKNTLIRNIRTWSIRIAAAVIFLIISGLGIWALRTQNAGATQQTEFHNSSQNIKEYTLADGSRIWLNPNSSIAFNNFSTDNQRLVELKGEAFFEVKRVVNKPFIVQTKHLSTQVLGTAFNVNTSGNDSNTEVSLVEGKISISIEDKDTLILSPGETITFNKKEGLVEQTSFKGVQPYTWKNDMIYFDKADVEEVTKTLSKWYETTFVIENEERIKTELVHRINRTERTLKQVLRHIENVADYQFEELEDNTYTVKPKE